MEIRKRDGKLFAASLQEKIEAVLISHNVAYDLYEHGNVYCVRIESQFELRAVLSALDKQFGNFLSLSV